MDWLDRMNQAIGYIEENIAGEISYGQAARIACCSTFHFQRMFAYIAGMSLSEYIRRRRMTAAAFELQTTDAKVIDLALKYGYDSPTAFNRAFRSVHGIAPSGARREGASLTAFPRISFTISIKGDAQMNYKIVTKDAFRIVGVKVHLNMKAEECFEKVPQFWQETVQSDIVPGICSLMDQPPYGLLGVSTCMDGEEMDYYIAVSTQKEAPAGMEEYLVSAGTGRCSSASAPCLKRSKVYRSGSSRSGCLLPDTNTPMARTLRSTSKEISKRLTTVPKYGFLLLENKYRSG